MGAIVKVQLRSTDGDQLTVQFGVDRGEYIFSKQPPAHSGLISAHCNSGVFLQQSDGFQCSGDGLPFIRVFDEVCGVEIDDAISV